tara:strand:- start:634 stop:1041 length:408 start_codon:yes stop_codon:yes gene_type:complete
MQIKPLDRKFPNLPVKIKDLKCPFRNRHLKFESITVDIFPYLHADLSVFCDHCRWNFLFGIPADPIAGKAKMTFGDDMGEAAEAMHTAKVEKCPFHKVDMIPTKYFGKHICDPPKLQTKCPKCYLIHTLELGETK